MTDISRRKLFGAAGAASLGLAGMVPVASASECGKPVKWNETKEFVIIGTGFAGLAAALEAHQGGMKSDQILILEKMSFPGGNSVINGGAVAAAGTDMQKAEGIKDSPDLLYADIIKAGGGLAHPELARHIADESVENFYWLRDKIGVKFKAVTYHGGHSVKRSHAVESNSGAGFILPMLERLKEVGIKPQLRTKVEQLIVNDKGCVEGVKAPRRACSSPPAASRRMSRCACPTTRASPLPSPRPTSPAQPAKRFSRLRKSAPTRFRWTGFSSARGRRLTNRASASRRSSLNPPSATAR